MGRARVAMFLANLSSLVREFGTLQEYVFGLIRKKLRRVTEEEQRMIYTAKEMKEMTLR